MNHITDISSEYCERLRLIRRVIHVKFDEAESIPWSRTINPLITVRVEFGLRGATRPHIPAEFHFQRCFEVYH